MPKGLLPRALSHPMRSQDPLESPFEAVAQPPRTKESRATKISENTHPARTWPCSLSVQIAERLYVPPLPFHIIVLNNAKLAQKVLMPHAYVAFIVVFMTPFHALIGPDPAPD